MTELLPATTLTSEHPAKAVPVDGYTPTEAERRFANQLVAENVGHVEAHDPNWVDHTHQAGK